MKATDKSPASKQSALRKASLFYLVFVMFSYTTGGPFGLEDMVTTSGPGITLMKLAGPGRVGIQSMYFHHETA